MSAHYSKFFLNTYSVMPYFHAHIPDDYPLELVLQKSRSFRKLPKRLRELSALAKQWSCLHSPHPAGILDIERWYDDDGYELDPGDGHRLTDEEINAQWPPSPALSKFVIKDIPMSPNGFADPRTWDEPVKAEEPDEDSQGPTEESLLRDISGHGQEYTAKYYSVPMTGVKSDKDLAQAILRRLGRVAKSAP